MVGGDGLGDGQAEAGVAAAARASLIGAMEAFEDRAQVVGGDARAIVAHEEHGVIGDRGGAHPDVAARRMMMVDGVPDEIGNKDRNGVGIDAAGGGGE